MVKPEELEALVGERVVLRLAARAPGKAVVTGRIVGVVRALDGLVVTLSPDGAEPGQNLTYHYQYVESAEPAGPPSQ
jgi:hypothetical protein